MYIAHIIPISRSFSRETLSYFTAEPLALGAIVEVPLQKRAVSGIVVGLEPVESLKAEIKSASFEMKKITNTKSQNFFLPEFINAAKETAAYFACSTGAVVEALTSKPILAGLQAMSAAHTDKRQSVLFEKYILQSDEEERFSHYKSLIRETFAKKASVFFCLPTIHDIETAVAKLEKGIEEYTFVLHGSLSKKELAARAKKMLATDHPVLIIASGPFLSLPRKDIGAIIVENESSRSYKTQKRPYIDLRTFAECFARHIKSKIIYGDIFLQTETMHRHQNGEFQELSPLKFRSLSTSKETIVDMRAYKTAPAATKKYPVLSDELKQLIEDNQEQSENLFIFVARKGLSPSTICGDCGNIVVCSACQSPMVLHAARSMNFFLCHKCGERRNAEETCIHCSSWRLMTLGAGAEKVEEEIRSHFPEVKLFTLDKDQIKTHKQAIAVVNNFYSSPGSILLGTEMALMYLEKPVENSAIATIDSLFAIPDFKISEKILSILLRIRSFTQNRILLQTRNPEQKLFNWALKGNTIDFYREELALRKMFNYPPFSVLVKISIEGDKAKIAEEMAKVKTMFGEYEVDVFPSFIKGLNGKSILNALMRIPPEKWPDENVTRVLISLPPNFTVKVDPDSLL